MQNGRTSSDSDPLFLYPGSTLVTNSMAYNNTPFRTNQALLSTASQPMQYCWPPISRCYQPEGTTGGKMAPYVKSEGAFSSSGGRKWSEEEDSHITVASCISNSRRRSSTLERDGTPAELSRKKRSPGGYSPNGTVSTEQTITKLVAAAATSHQVLPPYKERKGKKTATAINASTVYSSVREKKLHKRDDFDSTVTPARKSSQKLGDKVNALQQLVSPFGKTDTASVLQEATGHIGLLHRQIGMLIAPYFSYRPFTGRVGDGERFMDLRSRGLCLVPFSTRASNEGNEDTGSDCLTGGTELDVSSCLN